ncbi:hypothetical protein [Nocardia salmonicida]|uniref:hypothetical protein n=1 Tax=Nocardia salmonicida TaxID=53431 RepID=UPI003658F0F1
MITNRDNGTDLERVWWYDAKLVALDPDYAALIAEIDAIGARVRWCPPRLREPPRHRTTPPSAPACDQAKGRRLGEQLPSAVLRRSGSRRGQGFSTDSVSKVR